jgi:hypothetical protein
MPYVLRGRRWQGYANAAPPRALMATTRRALGFTPDEEKEVLVAARGESAEEKKLDEMLEILRHQEQVRNVVAAGAVIGLLFTLTRFGELVAEMRRKRREGAT